MRALGVVLLLVAAVVVEVAAKTDTLEMLSGPTKDRDPRR